MGYAQALDKAWGELAGLTKAATLTVRVLADNYEVIPGKKAIISSSCNVPAKDHLAVIILHYLTKKLTLKSLPEPAGEWIDFSQIADAGSYYPTFRKRTIDHIVRKFGEHPEAFLAIASRFKSRKLALLDASVAIEVMDGVEIGIALSKGDDEFPPDANILYDRGIAQVFCAEDIVVLTELVVHGL
jgi:hypothetical protein